MILPGLLPDSINTVREGRLTNTQHTRFAQTNPPVAALVDFRAGFFRCPTVSAGTTHNGKATVPVPVVKPVPLCKHK
jgi:hypothetical protein